MSTRRLVICAPRKRRAYRVCQQRSSIPEQSRFASRYLARVMHRAKPLASRQNTVLQLRQPRWSALPSLTGCGPRRTARNGPVPKRHTSSRSRCGCGSRVRSTAKAAQKSGGAEPLTIERAGAVAGCRHGPHTRRLHHHRCARPRLYLVASPATLAPDDTSRSVIRLVLTLVEFVRQLLDRQAVRRVREQTLNPEEIERDTGDSTAGTTIGASE